jgi:hypothetical protein
MRIIGDPETLAQLHVAVRRAPDAHESWRGATDIVSSS